MSDILLLLMNQLLLLLGPQVLKAWFPDAVLQFHESGLAHPMLALLILSKNTYHSLSKAKISLEF